MMMMNAPERVTICYDEGVIDFDYDGDEPEPFTETFVRADIHAAALDEVERLRAELARTSSAITPETHDLNPRYDAAWSEGKG
jgi:hypothetical protein